MLISPAFAQSGGFAEGGLGLMPIILVMVIFYFLLIRPQQKRAKQHKQMLSALKRGDKIITNGGTWYQTFHPILRMRETIFARTVFTLKQSMQSCANTSGRDRQGC